MKDNILEASEEQLLAAYLNSRGINAKFVTKDTKIAHAKSSQYAKWKADHWDRFAKEEVEHIEEKKLTSLQKFRKASSEREKKHADIEKQSKEKPDMKGAIDRLEKHLNKEESSITDIKHNGKTIGVIRHDGMGEYTGSHWDSKQNWSSRDRKELVSHIKQYHQRHLNKESVDAGVSKTKETSFHKKLDKLVHSTFGKRKDEMKKEEVEQIDEISKSTLASYKDKSTASLKNAQVNRDAAKPGKNMSKGFADLHAKSDAIAKKRVKGLIGYMQRKQGMKPTSEDVFHDTQAATQMPSDGANNTDDISPMKRERSKSARMIKSLYKSKNMKEDMYDWEKDDKSTKGYGKKPKMTTTDKKESYGENKPEAAAIMTGGKTLTGQDRDTIEIDPSMKKRPNQPDAGPQDGSKQDRK